jgi:threonine dehydratase
MNLPTFLDILHAQRVIGSYISPTPLHHVGAFKVRGGINLVSRLTAAEREQGVVTASTGNHGQSIAYAAKLFNVRATIVAPQEANPVKVEAMESHGAEVVFHGQDFDEAKEHCEQMAREQGLRYISSGDEPHLIAGVGTYSLEILEERPNVEMIFVPIGGGSGASGACLVAKTINPEIQVVGVQAATAPAAYLTWKNQKYTTAQMKTEAEGLATRAPFMLPQQILWQYLDDFVLVDEEAMRQAVRLYLEKAKTLAELAGAAPLAAAIQQKERVRGKTIAIILSGGNISPEKLQHCLT